MPENKQSIKSTIVTLIILLIIALNSYSQTYDRRYNPNYMWTTFEEDFSGSELDRKVWKPTTHFKRGLGFLVDSPTTIDVRKGNLLLKMKRAPNHLDSTWKTTGWQHVRSNFVGGEVSTIKKFQYGVFECRAKFAHRRGAWPAFWLIGGSDKPCPPGGPGNEIDIAELAREGEFPKMMHVIHHYQTPVDCDVSIQKNVNSKDYPISRTKRYYTFKCVWTPEKIQYFIDNELKHEVINKNYDWFPSLPLNLMLSQQVLQAYDAYGEIKPRTPQRSLFSWVRVKQFFLAPEISIPSLVASRGIATLAVDSRAVDISWKLTPESQFTTPEGKGSSAHIIKAEGATGPAKITYTFKMPSGEVFTSEKEFY